MNVIQKLIMNQCPDYDFSRYRFREGDMVETLDGALVIVEYSALEYVSAFPIRRSMTCRKKEFQRVSYSNLPYYKKGEFKHKSYPISNSIFWKLGDIVRDEPGYVVLLTKEDGDQKFSGFVLEAENEYYLHTRIYIRNPYAAYVLTDRR